MSKPDLDVSAYSGGTIIKTTLANKSKHADIAEYNRANKLIANLEARIARRLTFDSIDFDKPKIEDQMRVNMGVATELRKEMLQLKTFVANMNKSVDLE